MTYYIELNGGVEVLGEEDFDTMWLGEGYILLTKIAQYRPETLEDIKVVDQQGKVLSVDYFLKLLERPKLIIKWPTN